MLSMVARGLILICAVASAVGAPLSQTENDKSGSKNHKRNAEDLASAANDEADVGMNLQEILSICNESFRINFGKFSHESIQYSQQITWSTKRIYGGVQQFRVLTRRNRHDTYGKIRAT